jgi:hypothetical protein
MTRDLEGGLVANLQSKNQQPMVLQDAADSIADTFRTQNKLSPAPPTNRF